MKLWLPDCHLVAWVCIVISTFYSSEAKRQKRLSETDGWNQWEGPTACSRTCGGGVMYKHRTCSRTGHGDSSGCEGPRKIFISCNTEPCPEGSLDFRLEQCQKYNNLGLNIPVETQEEWIPYYGEHMNKCELNCLLKGTTNYYKMSAKVVDGTRCDLNSDDICVDGICQSVGCDGLLGSKVLDTCAVCGGDGSTCDTLKGDVKTHDLKNGYNDVLLLPAGATAIRIEEGSHSSSYIALRGQNGEYVLNKDWQIESSKNVDAGGSTFQYDRDGHLEILTSNGPLEEPVFVVIIRQAGHGAQFHYTYSVPHDLSRQRRPASYQWRSHGWTACSEDCAGGTQTRHVYCTDEEGLEVPYNLCNPFFKPSESQDCNTQPCTASWFASPWESCSTTCAAGVQVRAVFCRQPHHAGLDAIVPDDLCTQRRPENVQSCNTHVPCPQWSTGPWSRCNRICGPAEKVRTVTCAAQHQIPNARSSVLPDQRCTSDGKPAATEACNNGPCKGVEWIVSEWTGCRGTCSDGVETRQVVCSERTGVVHDDGMCDPARRPGSHRPCSQDTESCDPKPQWHASQWGKCSARCGSGVQRRTVICAKHETDHLRKLPEHECDHDLKMTLEQQCNGTDCDGEWFSGPFGKCSVACGGGQKQRQILCFVKGKAASPSECDNNARTSNAEDCNWEACDEDDLIVIGGCRDTPYGCCPDGITPAESPSFLGCPSKDRIPVGLCIESEFGCCLDGVTPSQGPFSYGCPDYTCRDTKYRCCSDGLTPADGPSGEGCPYYHTCDQTAFGCCPDNVHIANGFNYEGCDDYEEDCRGTTYGCCPDGISPALGHDSWGCDEGSGELSLCELSLHGCCTDGFTAAHGPNKEGCNEIMDCQGALYGCCPDGETAAQGPNFYKCPGVFVPPRPNCAASHYGCCPDGHSAARGPNQAGCLSGCANTLYGCCPDGHTQALGPDDEGCALEPACAQTHFGCCPDFLTAAQGPGYQGCPGAEGDCKNTLFGCCRDGTTPSGGYDYEGCPQLVGGCAGTRFGCCEDGSSAAHGLNKEGCPERLCHNSVYGCCPDGVTGATGVGYAGCPYVPVGSSCDQTAHGCCPDGVTVATGGDFGGCLDSEFVLSCENSAYGCCEDGLSDAKGPNHAGCKDKIQRGAACMQPNEQGPCSNYTIQWAFDPSYGDCTRFWYGGCEGNDNRFNSREQCKEQCVKPKGLDICYLPQSVGRCRATEERFYYNHESGDCETFLYGGCKGNDNRFTHRNECVSACVMPHQTDLCKQPPSQGPCLGQYNNWYFDHESQTCQEFVYGGCKGNKNRFQTKEDCEGRCLAPLTKVCVLQSDSGPCEAHFPRWAFNANSGKCEQFVYGGCYGNDNRFSSRTECEQTCRQATETPSKDICSLPEDAGPCDDYFERWFHDRDDGFCKRFVFGGCEGNENQFLTEVECRETCDAKPPVDECTLAMDVGPCQGSVLRFYYDREASTCRQMVYGGCEGNANNFETVQECQKVCGGGIVPTLPTDGEEHQRRCYMPKDTGPCLQALARWYYDGRTTTCREFEYGGCEGNRNRFLTEEICAAECMPDEVDPATPELEPSTTESTTEGPVVVTLEAEDMCTLPYNPGPCFSYRSQWYFDQQLKKCKQFLYGGCGGNGNRFESRADCEKMCTTADVCAMPADSGQCLANIPSWYYDHESAACAEFVYGGCGGNENRFETRDQCEYKCSGIVRNVTGLDVCALHHNPGPCNGQFDKYYYDINHGKCKPFVYGGCQGNENSFETKHQCELACRVEEICRLPRREGPCKSSKPRYHFNSATGDCEGFYYGGCDGNANRFLTLDSCQRVCVPLTEEPEMPAETTRRPDSAGSTSSPDFGGGVNVCKLRKDPGPCKGYNPVWYFEPNTRTCRRFLYGGCDGNGNKFDSRDACQQRCLSKATQPPRETTTQTITEIYGEPEATEADLDFTGGPTGSGSTEITTDSMDFDMCLLEKTPGEYCSGWELKWHFDATTASCRQFYYGGCAGNANRFSTQDDCLKMCVERRERSSQEDNKCSQPQDVGPCKAFQLRYYFDQSQGRCLSFQFGGCQGNQNNFEVEKDCYMACSEHMVEEPQEKSKRDCALPMEPGPCRAEFRRFYYDGESGQCRPFIYGGCQQNGNNFETQNDCFDTCLDEQDRSSVQVYSPGDCYDPSDSGQSESCQASTPRWFWDHQHGECRPFYFGCEGNGNNFLSPEDCRAYCSRVTETCGVLQCNLDCPFGYARYPDGCPKCECRDPCLTHNCPWDKECRVEEVVCVRAPCRPQIVCRPKPKAGECPKVEADNMAMCVTECEEDVECDGDAKCCSNGCGKICVVPYTPECRNSVFGCCPDGESSATGWNFIGCPEEAPMIEDYGDIDITAVEGEIVTIPCVSRGAPTPQVSWYKSRFPIQGGENDHMTLLEDGSLEIGSVRPEDSTSYTCRAYNNVGSATKTYTLLVQVPVTLVEISEDVRANPGEDLMLTCIATGNPTPEIRWLHGNQVIQTGNKRYFVDKDGTLMISRLVLSDDGVYMCEAHNGVGEPVTATTNVDVLGPFTVNIMAHNTTYETGSDLRLVCELDGDKTDVMVRWHKDGFPILEDESDRIVLTTTGELLIENLMTEDEGQYTCTATRLDLEVSEDTRIQLNRVRLPKDCTDKPWYANCDLIVEARMCRHPYFSIFCCQTCHEAGLLP